MATYTITTSEHDERCLDYGMVGIQTWISNAVATQIRISQQEIIKLNMIAKTVTPSKALRTVDIKSLFTALIP